MSKVCSKCGIEKSLDSFGNRKDSIDGKRNHCKDCRSQYMARYYIDNINHFKKHNTKYYLNNKEIIIEHNIQYKNDHPEITRKCNHNVMAKRRSWGEVQSINNWFKGSELHHLHVNDHTTCIYVPIELHNSIRHAWNKPKKMNEINKLITEWYLNINIKEI